MIHYINLGGRERPFTLVYSVPFDYEMENEGRYYNTDVSELITQMMNATTSLMEAQKTLKEDTAADYTKIIGLISKANSKGLSMVRLVNILYIALKVAHRIEKMPVDFTKHDVADWIGGNTDAIGTFTSALFQANFNVPNPSENGAGDTGDTKKKKKTPAR